MYDCLGNVYCTDGSIADISTGDVLAFATGADTIPPLVFPVEARLHLNYGDGNASGIKMFPTANTCGLVLSLPVVSSYGTFSKHMAEAIIQSPKFGYH